MKKHKKKSKSAELIEDSTTDAVGEPSADEDATRKGRAEKRTARRRVVNENLQLEIATLRQTLNEILDRYRLKLDAELVQIADATSGNGGLGEPARQLPSSVAESMLKQIRDLDIKPQKGRAKDLQRVQDLVGSLLDQLPAEK